MAININLGPRQDVETFSQPIARSFIGFDPKVSDEQLWNANRGVWELPEQARDEQFATFSHDGTIRLVAELEGIENVDVDGTPMQALMGRLLHRGDPVRDALVGQSVDATEVGPSIIDTAELDEMPAAERYAPNDRAHRTFLITHDTEKWFWSPEDEAELVARTGAGATMRECWSAGGRKQGIEPGDRVYLLERCEGLPRGVRGSGVVSSRIFQGEHWDDPNRNANYIEIDWDLVLESDKAILLDILQRDVPGYAWTPRKSGVELHQPMAGEMDALWARHVGEDAPALVDVEVGWSVDDSRRRVLSTAARDRIREGFEEDGWEVADTNEDRPYCAVAFRGGEQRYLFAKGAETVGRPVFLTSGELEFVKEDPETCVLGVLSDVEFERGSIVEGSEGIFTVVPLTHEEEAYVPVLYRHEPLPKEPTKG